MKKTNKILLIVLLIIIPIIFSKLYFLFFKVKICNKTEKNMYFELSENQNAYLLKLYSNIFWNNYSSKIVISFENLKPNECSKYKNIHKISNYPYITWLEYKNKNWTSYPYKLYETIYTDTLWKEKKIFWKYIYNIISTEDIDNTFKGNLYVESIKVN